jgi:hypothetical protein
VKQRPDPKKISFRRKWQQTESEQDMADRRKYVNAAARVMAAVITNIKPFNSKMAGNFKRLWSQRASL